MASAHPLAKHWAVLVGINFYGGAEDLKGCLHHVWAMKQYLQTARHCGSHSDGPCQPDLSPSDHSDVDAGIPSGTSSDFFQRDQLFRDAAVCPDQWLVAPDGYTILAACGPHEIARELQLAQGERRGALSYFLLDALDDLRKRCTEITHESLYEHLRVRFRASWPQQTPMRYGNKDMTFFGHLGARSDMAFFRIYYRAEDQRLCLDAGLAHGLHPNDEYAV